MARRFARRRRPGVAWLPVYGVDAGTPEDPRPIGVQTRLQIPGDGTVRWDVTTLTFDDSRSQPSGFEESLQDLVTGNQWRLRRIVGKLWAHWCNPESDSGHRPPVIDYAAGFIVGKTDDEGTPTADFDEVNPLVQEGADDPWIWRRRWFIGTTVGGNKPTAFTFNANGSAVFGVGDETTAAAYPSSTADYHSVADGPHIDQKTARRIDRQERLLFVQAARWYNAEELTLSYAAPGVISSFLDYRLLGSLIRTSSGNRRNASR